MNAAEKNPSGWIIGAFLTLGTLLLFWPVTRCEFLNFDDPVYVTSNSYVQRGLTWENVQRVFTHVHANFWHPLTTLSHILDWEMYGKKAGGHHLTSLLFHVGSVVLLFAFLQRMTGTVWRSALVAALFAWHPLRVESVAWVAERKDVLSTFFWMLTLWCYARYGESRGSNTKAGKLPYFWYGACFLSFALGLMAKPMLVTLPFVMLLLDYWPLRRATLRWPVIKPDLLLLVEKLPFFVLAAAAVMIAIGAQQQGGALMGEQIPLLMRLQNAVVSYVSYIGKTVWPQGLAVFYPYPLSLPAWKPLIAVVLLLGITGVIMWRRIPYLVLGWLWYLGTLVPVIGLMQVGSHAMADRYTYVPQVGLLIAAVWGLSNLAVRRRVSGNITRSAAGLVLIVLAALTVAQLKHWKNTGTLFQHTLAVTKRNPVAHVQLAAFAVTKGDLALAESHARQALELFPNSAIAHHVMGLACEAQQKWAEAAEHFSRTLAQQPDHIEATFGLATAFSRLGQTDQAIEKYSKVVQLNPEDPFPLNNLANIFLSQGRYDEAIARYTDALRLKPDYADARFNLAMAHVNQEKFEAALPHFKQLAEEAPSDPQVLYYLGLCLSRDGHLNEAFGHFNRALELAGEFPQVMSELAVIRATGSASELRNVEEAIRLAQRACELTEYKDVSCLRSLAAVLAEAGRFDEAISMAEKAISAAESASLTKSIESELQRYRSRQKR